MVSQGWHRAPWTRPANPITQVKGTGKAHGPGRQPGPELGPLPTGSPQAECPASQQLAEWTEGPLCPRCPRAPLANQPESPPPVQTLPRALFWAWGGVSAWRLWDKGRPTLAKGGRPGPRAAGRESCPEMPGERLVGGRLCRGDRWSGGLGETGSERKARSGPQAGGRLTAGAAEQCAGRGRSRVCVLS